MKSETGYIKTKLKIVCFASFVSMPKTWKYGMLNNVKVKDSFVKTGLF